MEKIIQTYFYGQNKEALWLLIPAGIGFIYIVSIAFKTQSMSFTKGLGIPLLILGLVSIFAGIYMPIRNSKQIKEITQMAIENPEQTINMEIDRMDKMKVSITRITYICGVSGICGLILFFVLNLQWSKGLGAALIIFSAYGLLVDGGFATNRVKKYKTALIELKTKPLQ